MSDYIINYTAPDSAPYYKSPFTVVDGTLNITDTALKLCGHNYPNYGATLWTNIVHMLENFCSNASPAVNTRGQLWYDSGNSKLMVYDGSDYVYISGNDNLTLTEANLDNLLSNLSPPYYDSRYVSRNGDTNVGSIEFSSNSNLTLSGTGTVKTSFEATDDVDVVNRGYIKKLFSYLGYDIDNFGTSISATKYLELIGGTMSANANIKFAGSGTVKVNDDPVDNVDVVTLGYANEHYVSFEPGKNTKPVANLLMSGPLTLYPDSCNLADDSLEAVPAQWVTDKIKAALAGFGGTGAYIPITATGTTVSNNLTFSNNNWIKVDLDAATWATDNTLVLNKKQADTLYVKKAGDSLTAHPFTFTQPATQPTADEEKLDALNVPTCGWVNHRIKDAVAAGGGSSGSTVTKLSTYGSVISVPASRTTEPTAPSQTITLQIPSNSNAIDYELRFGTVATATGTATNYAGVRARLIVKANGSKIYETISSGTILPKDPMDHLHTVKYSALANTASTLTVEMYAFCNNPMGTFTNGYDIQQWVIADPLSATVAIAASTQSTGGVAPGPAGSVTYVDFGNGMVMISGITQTRVKIVNTGLVSNSVYVGTDITFPNSIKLKIPYTITATHMVDPSVAKAAYYHDETWNTSNIIATTNVTQTSCSIDWMVALVSSIYNASSKVYYATPRDVHWTVTGFKV